MPNNQGTTNKPDEEEIAERDRQAQSGIDEDIEEERQGMSKTSEKTPELENDDDEHVDDEGVLEPDLGDREEGNEKPQTNV